MFDVNTHVKFTYEQYNSGKKKEKAFDRHVV